MKANKCLALLACSMLLAGCGHYTSVTDSSEKLMTIGNQTITKEDEYNLIVKAVGPNLTLQGALEVIYDAEVPVTDEMKEEAEETWNTYADSYDDFESQVKDYGYADKQDYVDSVLIPNLQSDALLEKYFTDAKEEIESEFQPVLAAIIQTDSEGNANKALQALKDGEDAGKVGGQYAMEDSSWLGQEQIITNQDTTLPTRLINTLAETTEDGVIDEVFSDDTSTDDVTYYVAKLVSNNYDDNVKAIYNALSSNSTISSDCVLFYLKKYDFEVHDQYIFDYFKALQPQYLVTRPDLSDTDE